MIDEEYTDSLTMGIGGVPGTFPTDAVLKTMRNQPGGEDKNFTRTQVNAIWFAYKDAVLNKKLPTWGDGQGIETRLHVEEVTGLPRAVILFWFKTVYNLIELGKIKPYFLSLDVTQAPLATKIFHVIREKTKDLGESTNRILIFTGITVLVIGSGYALSQAAKFRKKK